MKNLFQKSYYKTRIIITFGTVTILLVILLSSISYVFIKNLYLNQLAERVNTVSNMIASQVNKTYLDILQLGTPTKSTMQYFEKLFNRNLPLNSASQIFVFNDEFRIIVHSDSAFVIGLVESRLLLNEKEISELEINTSSTSLPFKGDDNNWYLWGFYRLNDNHWLGTRENASKLERVDDLALTFGIIGTCGVILTFLLSLFIAKSISKPVDKLVDYSSEIGKGNFNISIPEGMLGEIKTLAEAMDKMKNDLSENQKEREKMLAQIAHEIRNPLGGIELLAGLTKEDLQKKNLDANYIDKILKEVEGLKKLITSFLEFSRPMPSKQENFNLASLIEEVTNSFAQEFKGKDITVNNNLGPVDIYFDKGQLKQIIVNLISNSIQAIDTGGIISITSSSSKNKWNLIITDDGPGIPEENMDSIFEPFFTTKKNGTGLGLAISKKLCLENKSAISVKNNQGKGSTFTITGEFNYES